MEDLQKRIDGLIREVRDLSKQREEYAEEVKRLRAKMVERDMEAQEQKSRNEELCRMVEKLRRQAERRERRLRSHVRMARNESRRKELLNSRIQGSSRSQGEYYVGLEMKMVNERCEIMKSFIIALSERLGFDCEIFDELLEIADGIDDPVIAAFLNSIRREDGGGQDI